MTASRRCAALLSAVLCLTVSACTDLFSPEPLPPVRWSLTDELNATEDAEVRWDHGTVLNVPWGCEAFGRVADAHDSLRLFADDLSVRLGDLEVWRVVVLLGNRESWDKKPSETPAEVTELLIGTLDACAAQLPEERTSVGMAVFERTGSVEEERFGWYESSHGPRVSTVAFRQAEDPGSIEVTTSPGPTSSESPIPAPSPRQTVGRYTFVDDTTLVGVVIANWRVDIDLRNRMQIDPLLDALIAKVKADPPLPG